MEDFKKSIIDKINNLELSSFEKFLFIYKEILNSKLDLTKYSNLLTCLCNALNDDNLKCYENNLLVDNKNMNWVIKNNSNMVFIKDDKYNINGIYFANPVWDRITFKTDTMSLGFCLIPITDCRYIKDFSLHPDAYNPFSYMIEDAVVVDLKNVNNAVRQMLETQNIIDVKVAREKFKNIIFNNLKLTQNQKRYNELQPILNSTPFENKKIEYSFLKYVSNKLNNIILPIHYEDYKKALMQVFVKAYKMDTGVAQRYINKIIEKTKSKCFDTFNVGAKNCFFVLANAEFSRKQVLNTELEKLKERKTKKYKILEK